MAYSDFTLTKFRKKFNITIEEEADLFALVEPIDISDRLISNLEETTELALAINTEKARSEMIITPILLEVRRKANYQISLFSGTDFNVDVEQGLNGYCDFVISRSQDALPECSQEKIAEIQLENTVLKNVFDKLRNLSEDKRTIPFTREQVELSVEEIKILEENGVVFWEKDNYYMPEIFRLGLSFKLTEGKRPAVMALARRAAKQVG